MAGDWIKWVKGLTRRREVAAVAHKLGASRREVASACMELWEWADDNTTDGHVRGVTAAQLDEMVQLNGFAAALSESEIGWIRVTERGISFPNFERHNGETAKRRALNTNRQRNARVAQTSRSKRDKSATREEKRREESKEGAVAPKKGGGPPSPMSRPDIESVTAYGLELGLPRIECEKFHHYHASRGWTVGKQPMRDWRAALRTWRLNFQKFEKEKDPAESLPRVSPTLAQIEAVLHGDDE